MRIATMKWIGSAVVGIAIVGLAGCGTSTVSRNVATDGSTAQSIVFPDAKDARPQGGTFPNLENVRLIGAGMSKAQIQRLIGAPQFHEGVFGVREWDYLLNLRQDGANNVTVCQYKIFFDDKKQARSFYWQPESCAALLKPRVVDVGKTEQVYTFFTDALFAFDKSALTDITPQGQADLDALARKIVAAGDGITSVQVMGYADRLGGDEHNAALSENRAYTVMRYLVKQGVAQEQIIAEGRGKADPKVDCNDSDRTALIVCLAPNRRVEVRVEGRRFQASNH
ncbi:OmpA family protein [Dyella silvatica]|uniref:OmpA family protein n=1 Tax=Dyella silvatica TaxID=2992128 RepID=UPI002256B72E|nr:OmpA family protein [Dyella silvatica]